MMKHKQKENYGCGLYAVANACNLDNFITEERLKKSKEVGNVIGQLSKWMQDDGMPYYIDVLYYNHEGKKLPHTALEYYPEGEGIDFLPILLNVQYSENSLRHLVGGKIGSDKKLYLYDSLAENMEVTTLSKVNRKYYRVFGLFLFMSVENGDYVYIKIMRIKLFSESDIDNLEEEVNNFLKENTSFITDVNCKLEVNQFQDYYVDGSVCNQWTEYTMVVNYKEI